MADETATTSTTPTIKTEEYITDRHLKKYMIVISFLIISGGMFMYALKAFKEASPDFLAKFDGGVFMWYAISTLILTFPTIAIEIIKAVKSK